MEEEKQKNNVLIIIILLLLIVIVGLAGFIVYDKVIKKEKKINNSEISEKENKVEEKDCPECKCESSLKNVVGAYESEPFDAGGEMVSSGLELYDDNTFIFHHEMAGGEYGIYKVEENKITFYDLIYFGSDPTLYTLNSSSISEIGKDGSFNYEDRKYLKKDDKTISGHMGLREALESINVSWKDNDVNF